MRPTYLAATVPHVHRVVVAGVHPPSRGVGLAQLPLVVDHEVAGLALRAVLHRRRLPEGRHLVELT